MSGPVSRDATGAAAGIATGAPGLRGSAALDALRAALAAAANGGAGFVQLRMKPLDEATAFDGNDYDFLLEPRDAAALLTHIAREAKARGVSFLIDEADGAKTHVQLFDGARRRAIEADFWKEHGIAPPDGGRDVYVRFADAQSRLLRLEDEAGWRLPADLEALLYLCHLDTRHKDLAAPAVVTRLAHYRAAAPAEPSPALGDADRAELSRRMDSLTDAAALADASRWGLRALAANGLPPRPRPLEDEWPLRIRNAVRRRLTARLHRPVVAFVGPDGSGKSTLIEALRADPDTGGELRLFKHFFRMTRPYELVSTRHPLYRRLEDNLADERMGRLWFAVAMLQYLREMRAGSARGRVFVDRYFHDLLLRDVRAEGRTAHLGALNAVLARLFPLPDAIVQLYAPRETLLARKREIPPENLTIYGELVDAIYARRGPRMRACVSTSGSIDECIDFLRIVLRRVGS